MSNTWHCLYKTAEWDSQKKVGFNDKTKELNHSKSKVKNSNSNITMTWRTTLNP